LATAGFAPASTTSQLQLNADAVPFYGRSQDPTAGTEFGGSGSGGKFVTSAGFRTAGLGDGVGLGTLTSTGTGAMGFGTRGSTDFGGGGGTNGLGDSGGIGSNSVATTFPSPPPSATSDDVVATPLSSSFVGQRIPRKNLKRDDGMNMTGDSATTGGNVGAMAPVTSGGEGDEQLSALRAKIREKREKLQKMKAESSTTKDDSRTQGDTNADLAARNALRFSTCSSDRDQSLSRLMPSDLKDRGAVGGSAWSTPAQSSGDDEDENNYIEDEDIDVNDDDDDDDLAMRNLSKAKSLVGTCLSMCPDEELVRREKEGDIQLLEVGTWYLQTP
jgi:hypothetical protein